MTLTADWLRMMARYNSWQNDWMLSAAATLSDDARRQDRGAFFGSVSGTLCHLLWADTYWMSRFDGGAAPTVSGKQSTDYHSDWEDFCETRKQMDRRIENWATRQSDSDMSGDITWYSGLKQSELSQPKTKIYAHFFNHQTHHRGQVHAMLTGAGVKTSDTDLVFMELP
ncbi:DinB family protein [Neptunicoccus sediminis]|uniref:DinB family protein n=1 Tax=Neptunicoccus sediminis TaxID=1892596 RepID=UPI000845C751|nr:DinB family protein [Neptunicoccus sediminis]